MNQKAIMATIFCVIAVAAGVFQTYRFFNTSDPLGGQITRPIHCRCSACGAEFDLSLKVFHDAEYTDAVAKAEGRADRPADAPGFLTCPKCGKEYVAAPVLLR